MSLKNLINLHSLKEGDRLPTYNDLCKELSVSYMSVHRAMKKMEAEGKVSILPGSGAFLCDNNNHESQIKVTLNRRLAELLTSKDLRDIQRAIPNVYLRFSPEERSDDECDMSIINNEQLLLYSTQGKIQPVENLGISAETVEELGVKREIINQVRLNGVLQGAPIGINPVLLGVMREHLSEVRPDEKWNLDKFLRLGSSLTTNNAKPLEGKFGFCFANRTVHTHSLINSAGCSWEDEKGFLDKANTSALEKIWRLIHNVHSCFPEVPSTFQLTPSDRWSMKRIAMIFCTYSGVSELLKENTVDRDIIPWGGESAYYYVLTAKKDFKSNAIYLAIMKKLLGKNLQQKLLRQGSALPVTNDSLVRKRMQHFFGISQTAKLESICRDSYNPWKINGSPEAFFRSEYVVKDFLADLHPLSDWKKLPPDFGMLPKEKRPVQVRSI